MLEKLDLNFEFMFVQLSELKRDAPFCSSCFVGGD